MESKVSFVTVPEDYTDQRIDNFLFARFRKVPKSHIYRVIRKGEVRVNKKRVKAESRIQPGDVVRIPPLQVEEQKQVDLKPSQTWQKVLASAVIYEDADILAINKPSGLPVHGDNGSYGVIEVLKMLYPQYPHLELAHRLDKETSGCLLLAKKRGMLKRLHEAFREGRVRKTYYALTLGQWKKSDLHVDLPLTRREKATPECCVVVDKFHGKPSVTRFEVADQFKGATGVLAYPETGRTHQIRVHAQYKGHPLAGDNRYGNAEFSAQMKLLGLNRLFLHALKLNVLLPNHQPIKIQAPMPDELTKILENLTRIT
ncbi:MAG: RluA family pseudouridine synthase [Pseudomonadota bacterium]